MQSSLSAQLQKQIDEDHLSHAYLFTDFQAAEEFVKALHTAPIDTICLAAEENRMHILTEDISKMQEELKFKPYGSRRAVFIQGADSIPAVGQNKLLKTLEEPIGNTIFVLYAQQRDALLPTVLSRCTEIASADRLPDLDSVSVSLARRFYDSRKNGAVYYELADILKDILNDKENIRERSLNFLDAFENILREDLISTCDSERIGKQILLTEEARKNIRSGFSAAFAMKALALNIE